MEKNYKAPALFANPGRKDLPKRVIADPATPRASAQHPALAHTRLSSSQDRVSQKTLQVRYTFDFTACIECESLPRFDPPAASGSAQGAAARHGVPKRAVRFQRGLGLQYRAEAPPSACALAVVVLRSTHRQAPHCLYWQSRKSRPKCRLTRPQFRHVEACMTQPQRQFQTGPPRSWG